MPHLGQALFQLICKSYQQKVNLFLHLKIYKKWLIKNHRRTPNKSTSIFWFKWRWWCSGYHYNTFSFNKAWIQALHSFKSCLRQVGESRWWDSLEMVTAGNKAFVGQLYHKTIHQFTLKRHSSIRMTLDIGNDNKAIVPTNHPIPQKHQSTTRR